MSNRYLIVSLILHILILGSLGFSTESQKNSTQDKRSQSAHEHNKNLNIIPKTVEVTLVSQELTGDLSVIKQQPAPTVGIKDCKGSQWYGGIGIHQDGLGAIEKVVSGYPAFKSGLKEQDEIIRVDGLAFNTLSIKGVPGTPVRLTIRRGSPFASTFDVTIIREKICYGEI